MQVQYDIARKSQQERENLLVQANINYYAQPGETVALACNLHLSNEQLRKLRSWTKKWNLHLASERKTRSLAVEQMGDIAIGSELVQAVQHGEDVTRSLRPAAYAWVKNLQTLIESHLSSLAKINLLKWQEHVPEGPSLPPNEIWLKIGADKAGGNFKMAFQVINQPKPNSADHTIVFSCLEADDSLANMHVALDHFKEAVHELQQLHWR